MRDDELRALAERLNFIARSNGFEEAHPAASAILSLMKERGDLHSALKFSTEAGILAASRLARAVDLIRRKINDPGADTYDKDWKWWDEAQAFLTDIGG